ncbi:expressed protein [Arabidopsis lyrata subsp. lyrata]|uniref:Expressed protein n=1 Tax=Arabidopsis lyrata subsp. lyrata TaxID=81972 RepID=D7KP95_ARALL|nr:expressed protein [Arabidopsis lyrata subsp. lyrata]
MAVRKRLSSCASPLTQENQSALASVLCSAFGPPTSQKNPANLSKYPFLKLAKILM